MSKACDEHIRNPIKGYSPCAGCEVKRLNEERNALQLRLNAVEEENDRFRTLLYLAHPMTNDVAHDPDIYMEISEALEKRP